jgi:putative acetyltransferase
VRLATLNDLAAVAALYRDTILAVNIRDYAAEQVNAWARRWTNTTGWTDKITNQHFILEELDGLIVGFSSLTDTGHLDMMFVHKNYQDRGIARRLVNEILRVAGARKFTAVTTDASITARPFFERIGFAIVMPQTVSVDGIELTNYKMIITLHENNHVQC